MKNIRLEFLKYLHSVCDDEFLRQCALSFFDNLSSKFEGMFFTRENFETLNIDGVIVEQDVVKEVFKNKTKVSFKEIFLFLFKQNVKEISYYSDNPDKFEKNIPSGYFEYIDKKVKINKYNPTVYYVDRRYAFEHVSRPLDATDDEYNKLIEQSIFQAQKLQKEYNKKEYYHALSLLKNYIKHVMHHELAHVFEVKSFLNGKYLKIGLTNEYLVKLNNQGYFRFYSDTINESQIERAYKNHVEVSKTPKECFEELCSIGSSAFSEVLNEEFASILDEELIVKNHPRNISNDFLSKTSQMSQCSYNDNYDVCTLLHLALSDLTFQDFRFNSQKVIEKINQFNISSKASCRENFIQNFKNFLSARTNETFANSVIPYVKDCNTYSLLSIIMGVSTIVGGYNDENDYTQKVSDYKLLIQEMLIDAISSNVHEEFEESEDYFKYLNELLISIDNVIAYPKGGFQFIVEDTNLNNLIGEKTIELDYINALSIENYAKKFNYPYVIKFYELIKYVERKMHKAKDKIPNLNKIMSFFEKQHQIDQRYEALYKAHVALKHKKDCSSEKLKLRERQRENNALNEILEKREEDRTVEDISLIRQILLSKENLEYNFDK